MGLTLIPPSASIHRMKKTLLAALLITLTASLPAMAEEWKRYSAPDYGFSMLVPAGISLVTKEFGGGWGGLKGQHEGVTLLGIAKLGDQATAEEIENFGVAVTGIPADSWVQIDEGSGNGWKWYKTVKATRGSKVLFGGYGTGPKGSYLLLIETTESDFRDDRSDYQTWYDSIRLD